MVLVDEAAQATEPHTLVALNQLAADNCHAVFIGDHLQLAPTVKCQIADEAGLGRSLFELVSFTPSNPTGFKAFCFGPVLGTWLS